MKKKTFPKFLQMATLENVVLMAVKILRLCRLNVAYKQICTNKLFIILSHRKFYNPEQYV